LPQPCCPTPPP